MQVLFMILSMMTAIFLILLVLVQRGRGGGLTGALGGMGGQSAFGSKAGDLFTRITIGVAAFWIVLSVAAIKVLNTPDKVFGDTDKTTFDDDAASSLLKADPKDALPSAESTTDGEAETTSGEPAAEAATALEPPAPSSAEPAATESTEAAPEKAATPEKND